MVNTRAKIKKTQSTTGFSQEEDSDEQSGVFNDDILTEILLRLPVFSILRFKSVCKHWLWLLSDRCFAFRYDNSLSKSPPAGLFYSDLDVDKVISKYIPFDGGNLRPLRFCFDPCGIVIVQSCNGLLLCRTSVNDLDKRKYYVFNPTTKQFAVIPSLLGGIRFIVFMGLAFHQTDCVHYKLVCVNISDLDKDLHIQIYSSDTGKWKISVESPSMLFLCSIFGLGGVYWNGSIYFPPTSEHQFYFKINVEQLKSLTLPVEISLFTLTQIMYFGECRGHLHLIVKHLHENNKLRLDVYEMSCDHSGWSFKYKVELCELPRAFPEIIRDTYYDFKPVDLVRGEEEEDTFVVLQIPGKLIRYNVHDKSYKSFMNIIIQNFNVEHPKLHRYSATLASF